MGLLFLLSFILFGTSADALRISALFFILFAVSATDAERFIVPVNLTFSGIVFGIATSFMDNSFVNPLSSAAGAALAAGSVLLFDDFFSAFFNKKGLGDGDASVAGLIGAFVGWKASLFSLFMGSFLGLVYGLTIMFSSRKRDEKDWRDPEPKWRKIPFVPFIASGFTIWIILFRLLNDNFPF
ncbi:prepilin peptidase [candidate division WOR-3 bacterium]|nr:prepilin peptidase [candidate division WOR-3 bacterium]